MDIPAPREKSAIPDLRHIPLGCEAGVHEALVLWKRCDHRTIFIVENQILCVEIGPLTFGARGFRDRRGTILIVPP